jgi:hypothetical protein
MSLAGRLALRAQLSEDEALRAYWDARYGAQPRHFIGYRKPVNAGDYPCLCYVLTGAVRGNPEGDREVVNVLVAINEPDMHDEIMDGSAQLAAIENLILDSLSERWSQPGCLFAGPALVNPDLEAQHPFYRSEIALPLLITGESS